MEYRNNNYRIELVEGGTVLYTEAVDALTFRSRDLLQ